MSAKERVSRDGDISLHVRRGRWIDDLEKGFYEHRTIEFDITADGRSVEAEGVLIEWRSNCINVRGEFFDAADAFSQEDMELASILSEGWRRRAHPLNCGHVVRFDRLHIKHAKASDSRSVWILIRGMIEDLFGKTGSLLLLKAFPLGYHGGLGNDASKMRRDRFDRRRAAMYRLYAGKFGVQQVGGSFADEGWMWRKLKACYEPKWPLIVQPDSMRR